MANATRAGQGILALARGFTLIEFIMAILIIVIIATVVINSKANLAQMRTRQAAYKIKSDLRYTQSYALSSQLRTRIAFNPASETYSIYAEDAGGSWNLLKDPLTKGDFTVNLNAGDFMGTDIVGVNFDGTNYGLLFDAAGRPFSYNPSSGAASALSSQGTISLGYGLTLKVEPTTGKVGIE